MDKAITAPKVSEGCRLTGGIWYSYYDDKMITDASGLDVDHMVSVPAMLM